jgi:hypothetical protein
MKDRRWLGCAVMVVGCGSTPTAPSDPSALTKPLAQNVTISEIAMLQTLKVPVMQDGTVATRGDIPLIALRDSILRVYVTPGNGFTPHELTASARIVTTSPTGNVAELFSTTAMVSGASVENDLTTTLNIPIPGINIEMGSSITVALNDKTGDPATIATSAARWPADGSQSDLAVAEGGDHLKVMIVPVQYQADGSNRLPDTSQAQMSAYANHFYQLYPTAEVDMSIHDPWPYNGVITGDDVTGFEGVLTALGQLRSMDQPDPDVYYYAAFEPAADFGTFCGGGCVAGLSGIGTPYSVGLGYTGSEGTAVHEVGHAHGRYHAPCGGAANPDPMWPGPPIGTNPAYANALIGVWGYDVINNVMVDPTLTTDMMSYCGPTWISDFHYNLIFTRIQYDNQYYNDWVAGTPTSRFAAAPVTGKDPVRVSTTVTREPWIMQGQPREATWAGGSATTYFFPYDHAPGGILYVPETVPTQATIAGLRDIEPTTTILR